MKKTEIIRGRIVGCTAVEHYTKRNGEKGQKCVLHVASDEGTERAVVLTDNHTHWRACVGMDVEVEVEYIHRVFPFLRKGKDWIGNDLYATNIKAI